MGILNITPDSFSGDGRVSAEGAITQGLQMAAEGAHILDIGGESTRPGSKPVDAETEIERVAPVISALANQIDIPISIDTSKAAVADAALKAGATIVNDVRGLTRDSDLAAVVASARVPVVITHDSKVDESDRVIESVTRELSRRVEFALQAGIAFESIIVDPGFGFGKTWRQNLELLHDLAGLK